MVSILRGVRDHVKIRAGIALALALSTGLVAGVATMRRDARAAIDTGERQAASTTPEGIANSGTWPFAYDDHSHSNNKAGALLDLRYLNEKVAGENGFVKLSVDGNSFVSGNGKPIRFWAVVSDLYRLPPDDMAKHARFLAKMGVNMVRLHTQIAPTGKTSRITDVNEKEIDGIWHAVAALKKEGIYTTISPYWATDKDAAQWGLEGVDGKGMWGILFFNAKLQAGYKAWAKALYARPNPYTNIPLALDSAVAIVQVQNEDSLLFWTMQGLKPEQQEILSQKFGTWLTKKYGTLDAAKKAWDNTAHEKDNFAQGKAGMFLTYFLTQDLQGGTAKRVHDQTQFLAETQYRFYTDITAYYKKDLGCKQIVNASNWVTADPIRLNDIERWTYTAADVLAINKYTGGVHTGDNNGWRIDPGHHFTNSSCLLDPRALPTNLKQVAGHPMMITESSWVSPEGFQSEGPLMMAAYQSLTGIDTFYWFAAGGSPAYEPNPYFTFLNMNGQHPLHKWTCATPMLMGTFPAAALLFRQGYVKQGEPVVHEERSLESMWSRQIPLIAEDRSFDPNRYTGNTGEKSNIAKGVDPLAFLVGPVEVKYGGESQHSRVADLSKYIDTQKKTVRSVTGEVALDYGAGLFTLNAPRAQGVSGFLNRAGEITLGDTRFRSTNGYATVAVVAMDDQPLATSHKILVQCGTYARPTNWQSRPTDFKSDDGKQVFHGYEIVNTGTMPWQIANSDVTLAVKNTHLTKATVLDAAGYTSRAFPLTNSSGWTQLRLPSNALYTILE